MCVCKQVEECILWVSIVFITILCTPQPTIVRWSSTPAVSAEAQVQWRGFCALIANAYYVRGMAWYITFTSEEKLSTSESASTEKHDCQIGEIIWRPNPRMIWLLTCFVDGTKLDQNECRDGFHTTETYKLLHGICRLPVKTLQMEQLAVVGYAEEPSLVADRMRLVFATLEVLSFPSLHFFMQTHWSKILEGKILCFTAE